MDTPTKQSMDAKDKTMLTNVKKTINGYKKAQGDDKELASQLKVLKSVLNLLDLENKCELTQLEQANILAYRALGYKALGLDRDALVLGNEYLQLQNSLLENKLAAKDAKALEALDSEIKALSRSCARRHFDLSVRTICVDLFVHVKSFIDFFNSQAELMLAKLNDSQIDVASLEHDINTLFKLLKLNASCQVTLIANGNAQDKRPLITLNTVEGDYELSTLYACFFSALSSYGNKLNDVFSFALNNEVSAEHLSNAQSSLARAFAELESNKLVCPSFLQDSEIWHQSSRNLNLEPLSHDSLSKALACEHGTQTQDQVEAQTVQTADAQSSKSEQELLQDKADLHEAEILKESEANCTQVPESDCTTKTEQKCSYEPVDVSTEQETLSKEQQDAQIVADTKGSSDPKTPETNEAVTKLQVEDKVSNEETKASEQKKLDEPRVDNLNVSFSYTAVSCELNAKQETNEPSLVAATKKEPEAKTETETESSANSQANSSCEEDNAKSKDDSQCEAKAEQDNVPNQGTEPKLEQHTDIKPKQAQSSTQDETQDNSSNNILAEPTHIVASNAYQANTTQAKRSGGIWGFFRHLFGSK